MQSIWMILFLVLILFYPKYMLYKMIADMDSVARKLETYTKEGVDLVVKVSKEKGKPKIDPKAVVESAIEFFLIPPVSLDPVGILKKLEHVLDNAEDKFESIAKEIAPKSDDIWNANIISLLKGAIGLNMIAKIVRHYVEFVKKTGNLQIAMFMQMQMPLIKKIAKAQREGVEAISKGEPLGDSIGALVAANMIRGDVATIAKDVVYHETDISGRKVYIIKADGPGANLGKLGDAVKKIGEEKKIDKIITIDASLKLEGEETGKVCEGVGAAIGDPGPEKAKMEEIALKLGIPLEALAIKMSIEEAISPLTKKMEASVGKTLDLIKARVKGVDEKGKVLVVGVGNTCGIGNSYDVVKDLEFKEAEEEEEEKGFMDNLIKKFAEKMQEKEEIREILREEERKAKKKAAEKAKKEAEEEAKKKEVEKKGSKRGGEEEKVRAK